MTAIACCQYLAPAVLVAVCKGQDECTNRLQLDRAPPKLAAQVHIAFERPASAPGMGCYDCGMMYNLQYIDHLLILNRHSATLPSHNMFTENAAFQLPEVTTIDISNYSDNG